MMNQHGSITGVLMTLRWHSNNEGEFWGKYPTKQKATNWKDMTGAEKAAVIASRRMKYDEH